MLISCAASISGSYKLAPDSRQRQCSEQTRKLEFSARDKSHVHGNGDCAFCLAKLGNIVAEGNVSQFSRVGNKKIVVFQVKNIFPSEKYVSQFSHHENNAD